MMPILISDVVFVISFIGKYNCYTFSSSVSYIFTACFFQFIGIYLFFEETRQTDKPEIPEKLVKSMTQEMPQKIESDSDGSSTDEFTDLYSNSDIEYERSNSGWYNTLCADTCRHLVHVQRQQLTCIINCLVCGQRCKRNHPETVMKKTEPEPYTRKNFFFLLRNHLNSDIVLSLIIYIVVGSAGFMIFEVTLTIIIM